jgi:ATP:ADP antiporter, AAA family
MAFADAPSSRASAFHRLLNKIIDVGPNEIPALAWCWLFIFSLLSSYYILRPIRDQMGVAGGVNNLQWLFTGTLIGMLVLNLPFSYLVKTYPREKFIAISYRFFSANILLFALALYSATPEQTIWIGRIFFIWTSIFNLFVVSIFWQMIVDIFTSEQGKRLFGFIAAGATLGAISGSVFTVSTVEHMAPGFLMIGAALMLEVAVFCVRRLSRLSAVLASRPQADQQQQPIGGTLLGGIRDALSSGYLLNVSLFLLLYAVTSTFLYFQQAAVVSHSFQSRAAQTALFATVDLGVNVLTLIAQLFLTGRILKRFGVATTLSLLPVFSILGFGAMVPSRGW